MNAYAPSVPAPTIWVVWLKCHVFISSRFGEISLPSGGQHSTLHRSVQAVWLEQLREPDVEAPAGAAEPPPGGTGRGPYGNRLLQWQKRPVVPVRGADSGWGGVRWLQEARRCAAVPQRRPACKEPSREGPVGAAVLQSVAQRHLHVCEVY